MQEEVLYRSLPRVHSLHSALPGKAITHTKCSEQGDHICSLSRHRYILYLLYPQTQLKTLNKTLQFHYSHSNLRDCSSSGVESLSTASSLASASCCALAAPSSPDSETSDYRASPRPAPRPSTRICTRANTGGSASTRGGTRPRRRATVPPCRVSLAKLSLPAELSPCPLTATPTATPTSKKIKLEADVEADDRLHPSQDTKPGLDTKCNVSVLPPAPSILAHGCQVKTEAGASLLARLKAEPALSSAAVKLELAQLDSQLAAGKLLLDSASHQLRDMLLMDKINSRLYSKIMENIGPGYTVKHEAEDAKTAIDDKVEITKNNHNNNNVNEKKPREKSASTEYSDEEYVTCKWKGCDNRMEVQHLLEHLMVSVSSN